MKFQPNPKTILFFIVFSCFFLNNILSEVQGQTSKTLEDLYPGLASGALKSAALAKLPKGILLIAGDLIIKESEITQLIRKSEPGLRKQLSQNYFYLLENMAIEGLLRLEASQAGFKGEDKDQAIINFLSEKIKVAPVSEEELKTHYSENKEIFQNAPLEEIGGMLKEYLARQKREEAVQQYMLDLGSRTPIRISEAWARKQSSRIRNNPVDQARLSGKPTLVEFGAPGCAPCDMMKPVLASLKKKFTAKLNILFVHVGQEEVLGNRFGIEVIPVQVFFDQKGREVFRHTGFFPQAEIEKKITQLGLL